MRERARGRGCPRPRVAPTGRTGTRTPARSRPKAGGRRIRIHAPPRTWGPTPAAPAHHPSSGAAAPRTDSLSGCILPTLSQRCPGRGVLPPRPGRGTFEDSMVREVLCVTRRFTAGCALHRCLSRGVLHDDCFGPGLRSLGWPPLGSRAPGPRLRAAPRCVPTRPDRRTPLRGAPGPPPHAAWEGDVLGRQSAPAPGRRWVYYVQSRTRGPPPSTPPSSLPPAPAPEWRGRERASRERERGTGAAAHGGRRTEGSSVLLGTRWAHATLPPRTPALAGEGREGGAAPGRRMILLQVLLQKPCYDFSFL